MSGNVRVTTSGRGSGGGFAATVESLAAGAVESVRERAVEDFRAVAKQARADLKRTSPRKSGEYAAGWAYKVGTKNMGMTVEARVYQKASPGLTHLLERGHEVVAWGERAGRAEAIEHIEPAYERARRELEGRLGA